MTDELSFASLNDAQNDRVIFRGVWGSHAFGTAVAESDRDSIGVFILEKARYLSLNAPTDQIADATNDHRFYALRNYFALAAKGNPNVLDTLFLPQDCILKSSVYWEKIRARRDLFMSREAGKRYCEYALGQIKKAKGLHQFVRNPQPETPPRPEKFCRFISLTDNGLPGRPRLPEECGIDLREYHVAALENSSELFRLYHYKNGARGVFRDGNLVCESIPLADEKTHFRGFLLFNKNAFEHAKTEHRNYWLWRKSRNERRWRSQESGELDYNAKNLMHTIRLLYSGLNIMKNGEPLVRFSGKKRAELRTIRDGGFSYEKLIGKATELASELISLQDVSSLPESSDKEKIDGLLCEITRLWEEDHAKRNS